MTSAEAADALGVKAGTLYTYVSRGLLRSEREPGHRASKFRRTEVERLAARRQRRAAGGEIVIDSAVTLLDANGVLAYRGRDVDELARTWTFEQTAEWLWLESTAEQPPRWRVAPATLAAARHAHAALPKTALPADRLRLVAATAPTTDPLRYDRRPEAVAAAGRQLISALVEALPAVGRTSRGMSSLAARLWPRLTKVSPSPARVAALDRALILLADHEMAASTFAARVAASTWADPYLVVLSGLCALSGPLHGGASRLVRELLREACETSPAQAVGEHLRRDGRVPGIGHSLYTRGDPRAPALLDAISAAQPPVKLRRAITGVIDTAGGRYGPEPNVDFALGSLEEAFDMVPGAGDAIFAVARTAGLIAHAIEEYEHRLRYRPRGRYVGQQSP